MKHANLKYVNDNPSFWLVKHPLKSQHKMAVNKYRTFHTNFVEEMTLWVTVP